MLHSHLRSHLVKHNFALILQNVSFSLGNNGFTSKNKCQILTLNYTEHNCIYNVHSRLLYIHVLISEWHISQSRLQEVHSNWL